jgi:hypothetical protein
LASAKTAPDEEHEETGGGEQEGFTKEIRKTLARGIQRDGDGQPEGWRNGHERGLPASDPLLAGQD